MTPPNFWIGWKSSFFLEHDEAREKSAPLLARLALPRAQHLLDDRRGIHRRVGRLAKQLDLALVRLLHALPGLVEVGHAPLPLIAACDRESQLVRVLGNELAVPRVRVLVVFVLRDAIGVGLHVT